MVDTVEWEEKLSEIPPVSWICAYCDSQVATKLGLKGLQSGDRPHYVLFCPGCGNPTHMVSPGAYSSVQVPEPSYGVAVGSISDKDVGALYLEARTSISNGAYTAAVLCCRKILMHVAVALGAEQSRTFAFYVEYLKNEGHVTAASGGWVRAIKDRGNEQNHEIRVASREEAEDIVDFCAMLLQTVYEYPARAKQHESRIAGQKQKSLRSE